MGRQRVAASRRVARGGQHGVHSSLVAETLRDGRYAILRVLGEGAQGSTFEASDHREGKVVAIKNEAEIRARPGVKAVVKAPFWPRNLLNAVIVVADSYWIAKTAADAAARLCRPAGSTSACWRCWSTYPCRG